MNISQVLFSLRVLFLQENRIHAVGGCFQRGNNRVPARPVKGKLIISGQEDEISGLGRGLIVQAFQNIKK